MGIIGPFGEVRIGYGDRRMASTVDMVIVQVLMLSISCFIAGSDFLNIESILAFCLNTSPKK